MPAICQPAAIHRRALFRKTLRNLKGGIVLGIVSIYTILWFIPLSLFTLLGKLVPIDAFRRMMSRLAMGIGENWISCNTFLFNRVNRTRYTVRGADGLTKANWYLVIVNHQTWVDVIALQAALNRRIPFLKFFVKQQLIWFPVLGLAFWAMDMPFMKRYSKGYLTKHPEKKGQDLEATRQACERFRSTPTSVINFIEGTRFSEEKRVRRESPYQHLLPPRSGGLAVALASMGDMYDAVLDVTLLYPQGIPQFWDVMCGGFREVIVEVRQRPVEDWLIAGNYAEDREFRRRFHRWLAMLWEEKDERLGQLRAME